MTAVLLVLIAGLAVALVAVAGAWARSVAELERERAVNSSARGRAEYAEKRLAEHFDRTLTLLGEAEQRASLERGQLTEALKELVVGPAGSTPPVKAWVSEDDELRQYDEEERARALASIEAAERAIAQSEQAMNAGIPVTA